MRISSVYGFKEEYLVKGFVSFRCPHYKKYPLLSFYENFEKITKFQYYLNRIYYFFVDWYYIVKKANKKLWRGR